ncbi:hypothetical protein [Leptolyngbya sp. FACHB-261]|uniref:hypothetical protein n=1 Tax=Leptolyngbya sp. FACHB-261 TaxID=2692806 RepID=UPI0016828287|nr:hypothetical protein [Leptolyngbya sp. FACHB-261]MBD2105321.1 hypothetical protein [Leptolyngbya sp. FACHB-261]
MRLTAKRAATLGVFVIVAAAFISKPPGLDSEISKSLNWKAIPLSYRDKHWQRPEDVAQLFTQAIANADLAQATNLVCQKIRSDFIKNTGEAEQLKLLYFILSWAKNMGPDGSKVLSIDLNHVEYQISEAKNNGNSVTVQLRGYFIVNLLFGSYQEVLGDNELYQLEMEDGEWRICSP